jgi:hypothetical protein
VTARSSRPRAVGSSPRRLADAGLAHDRDQLAGAAGEDSPPSPEDQRQLDVATDEGRLVRSLRRIADRDEAKRRYGLALALQRHRLDLFGLDHPVDEVERRLPEQDVVRLGRLLEASRKIDRVAGREPLLGAGQHLAGVHADPAL